MIATVPSRTELYRQFIPQGAVGAELGVSYGWNAYQLYVLTHPRTLYLVDPYIHPLEQTEPIEKHARRLLPHDNVKFVKQHDWDWLPTLPPKHLDWVYLDTQHSREATTAELELLIKQLSPGGILAGHDFCIDPMWGTGVVGPVLDAVQSGKLELLALSEDFLYPSFLAKVL